MVGSETLEHVAENLSLKGGILFLTGEGREWDFELNEFKRKGSFPLSAVSKDDVSRAVYNFGGSYYYIDNGQVIVGDLDWDGRCDRTEELAGFMPADLVLERMYYIPDPEEAYARW